MTPERWAALKERFELLREMPEFEQEAALLRFDDYELAQELREMLAGHRVGKAAVDESPSSVRAWRASVAGKQFESGDCVAGRFEIRSFAGSGGMGEVYEAYDRELGQRVALKTLRREHAADPKLIERFKREVQHARTVTHANVCRVFEFAWAGEIPFCTMEFVEGESLADMIRRDGALAAPEALRIARACAEALDVAHGAKVLHCDFKSANVLIERAGGGVKVTDFGLARAWVAEAPANTAHSATAQTSTGAVALGTPAYMAPEQLRGEKPTPRSDIYAFGVVLYEMATGKSPYEGVSPVAMVAKKVTELPLSPELVNRGLPEGWAAAILRCVAIRAEDRFERAVAAVEALEAGRGPAFRWPEWRRWQIGRRVWLGLGGAAVVSAVAAGGWVWWRGRKSEDANSSWLLQGRLALAENAPWRAAYLFERRLAEAPDSKLARAWLAIAYAQLDRLDAAKDLLLALDSGGEAGPYIQAARAIVLRDYEAAAPALDALLVKARGTEKLVLLLEKASVLTGAGKARAAIPVLEEAGREFPQEAVVALQRGILEARLGGKEEVLAYFQKAAAEFRKRDSPEGMVEALYQQGRHLQSLRKGSLESAGKVLEEALTLAQATGNLPQRVRLGGAKAGLLLETGKRAEAEALAEETARLAEANDLMQIAAAAENDLAGAYLAQYELKEAEAHTRQAMRLAGMVKARREEARANLQLAEILNRSSRCGEALPHVEKGLRFYEQGGYQIPLNGGRMIHGIILMNLGRQPEAAARFQEVVGAGSPQYENRAKEWLADLETWRGNFGQAYKAKAELAEVYAKQKRSAAAAYMRFDCAMFRIVASRMEDAASELRIGRELLGGATGVDAILERGIVVEAQLRLASGKPALAVAPLSRILSSATVRSGPRFWLVGALLGEAQVRQGAAREGWARCRGIETLTRSLEIVEVRTEVLARAAVAALLASEISAAKEHALAARELAIRHSYRYWQMVSLAVLQRLAPQEGAWRIEREQLRQSFGQDEVGALGPRFDARADFQQLRG